MPILQKFIRLFTDTSVYREIVNQSLKQSLFTFLSIYFLGSLLASTWINYKYYPAISATLSSYANYINQNLPKDATIAIQDGKLTTNNLTSPYTIPVLNNLASNEEITNLVYISPQEDLTSLASSSAYVSLGATDARLTTQDGQGTQIFNYAQEGLSAAFSGGEISQGLSALAAFVNNNRFLFIPLLAVPIFFSVVALRIIHSLIYAALFSFSSVLFNRKYNFAQFLNIALHTTIVAEIIYTVVALLYNNTYPIVFTIAFLGATVMAYFSLVPNVQSPKED